MSDPMTGRALDALRRARGLGLPVPPRVLEAEQLLHTIGQVRTRPLAEGKPLPGSVTAEDLLTRLREAAVDDLAAERIDVLAERLTQQTNEQLTAAIAGSLRGWIDALAGLFDDRLQTYRRAAVDAPPAAYNETHRLPPEAFRAWTIAQTAASDLTDVLDARLEMGRLIGDELTLLRRFDPRIPLACLLRPPMRYEGRYLDALFTCLVAHDPDNGRRAVCDALLDLEAHYGAVLALAPSGQGAARQRLVEIWQGASQAGGPPAGLDEARALFDQLAPVPVQVG